MRYELIAVLAILLSLVILGMEYLWLYLLAVRQEEQINRHNTEKENVKKMIEGALYSPTETAKKEEIARLEEYAFSSPEIPEMVCDEVNRLQKREASLVRGAKETLDGICRAVNPIEIYGKILEQGDVYDKSYACRKLADYGSSDHIEKMRELARDKNRSLAYNAAMALSRLGDAEAVAAYLVRIQDDKHYSFRVILEMIRDFTGDRGEVAARVMETCNEYMKTVIIKAVAPYRIRRFESVYLEGMGSANPSMKIACTKALGDLADAKYEQTLIIASKDKDWVVRSYALKGLAQLQTPEAIRCVKEAVKDPEWWVRHTAAQALVDMRVSIRDLEDIMKGYDKYATDAIKYSLYRAVDVREADQI